MMRNRLTIEVLAVALMVALLAVCATPAAAAGGAASNVSTGAAAGASAADAASSATRHPRGKASRRAPGAEQQTENSNRQAPRGTDRAGAASAPGR